MRLEFSPNITQIPGQFGISPSSQRGTTAAGTMASTADHHRDARRRSEAIATTLDRSRDFRRASRHTAVVRTMRTALPLVCLAAAGGYGLTVLQRAGWGGGVPAAVVPRITPENLVMNNPHYEGFNPNGGRYTVSARTARQDLARPHVIELDGITAVTTDANDVRTDLTARQGVFDNQTKLLELAGGVDVVSGSGLKARLATATVEISESIVTSRDPVEVEMTAGRVRASEMKLRHKSREVTFIGSVETHVEPPRPPETARTPRAAPQPAFGGSGAPIDITSNRLDVNDQTKLAVFSGAVRAVQDGATLSSPHLHVTYSGQAPGLPAAGDKPAAALGTPTATGDKVAVAAAQRPAAGSVPAGPVPAGKVERITASGPVEMTQASGDRAVSDSADFDAVNGRAYLNGNVVMSQAPDRRAMAQRAEIDQRAETVLLVGDVTISQGSNELRGHRLLSDRKTARTQVTSPKEDGGNGRIAARFVRNSGVGAASTPAAAKPAAASPFGASFKTDPGAPVDVEAESLDIDDVKKTALFQGNVRAVQGGFTLRTVEMTAYYSGEAGLGGDGGQRDKAADKMEFQWRALRATFEHLQPADVETTITVAGEPRTRCHQYAVDRHGKGLARATIHSELSLLRSAMSWAAKRRCPSVYCMATKAAINNADWLFLLRQKPENIERLGKEGKLSLDEWLKRQLGSVSTEHGYYSEIYIHSPMGSGLGRLILDPFSMLVYSTRAEDYEAIKRLREQGLSVADAIEQLVTQRAS